MKRVWNCVVCWKEGDKTLCSKMCKSNGGLPMLLFSS